MLSFKAWFIQSGLHLANYNPAGAVFTKASKVILITAYIYIYLWRKLVFTKTCYTETRIIFSSTLRGQIRSANFFRHVLNSCRIERATVTVQIRSTMKVKNYHLLRQSLEKVTHCSQAVPVELQDCLALRFYASGTFQNVLGRPF